MPKDSSGAIPDETPEGLEELEKLPELSVNDVEVDDNPYLIAIRRAWQDSYDLQDEERRLTIRKAQLKSTIEALFPLAFPDFSDSPDITTMTLADAIRMIVNGAGRSVSVKELRGKLQDVGFDLSKYDNPLASIHTAARRMVDSEELSWVDDEGKKLQAGPEMKPIPNAVPTEQTLSTLLGKP